MILFLTFLFASIPLFLIYIHLKWKAIDKRIGASGPPCIPILGNLHLLWHDIRNVTGKTTNFFTKVNCYGNNKQVEYKETYLFSLTTKDSFILVHQKILKFVDEYGETIRLRFGFSLIIFTRDVKIIEVLTLVITNFIH